MNRWRTFLAGIALACLVWVVFFPILGFAFVELDVGPQVLHNPGVQGLSGDKLKHIFTSRGATGSYYPVRALSHAVDYQIWDGPDPRGFKLTNVLIHQANVLLVFWLILRLMARAPVASPGAWRDVSVATFAAGVFAIHPVVVEPVTWVAAREELLMTLGALGAMHFHLSARRLDEENGRVWGALACYLAAALCCGAACLSNAVGAVIPLLIVAWDVLMLPPPRFWRILYGTAALWAISAAAIVLKILGSQSDRLAKEAPVFSADRLALVLKVYWLNLKTLVWPTDLALSYEAATPARFRDGEVLLGGIAIGLTCWALWKLRRRKWILLGLLWFGLALGPTSQMMPHHIHRADRFLYLPLVGLAVAAAMAARPVGNVLKGPLATAGALAAGVAVLLAPASRSACQVWTWRDNVTLWDHCLRAAPGNVVAWRCLADSLASAGRFDLAIPYYQTALEIDPDSKETLNNFAFQLGTHVDEKLRDYRLAIQLAERGCRLTGWNEQKVRRTLAIACSNYAVELGSSGRFRQAIDCYRKALKADPEYEVPWLNLAMLLATCPDDKLRDPEEAVRLAGRGCRLADPPDPTSLMILAAAYAEAGQPDAAVTTIREALPLARAAGDAELVGQLRSQLELYQARARSHPSS